MAFSLVRRHAHLRPSGRRLRTSTEHRAPGRIRLAGDALQHVPPALTRADVRVDLVAAVVQAAVEGVRDLTALELAARWRTCTRPRDASRRPGVHGAGAPAAWRVAVANAAIVAAVAMRAFMASSSDVRWVRGRFVGRVIMRRLKSREIVAPGSTKRAVEAVDGRGPTTKAKKNMAVFAASLRPGEKGIVRPTTFARSGARPPGAPAVQLKGRLRRRARSVRTRPRKASRGDHSPSTTRATCAAIGMTSPCSSRHLHHHRGRLHALGDHVHLGDDLVERRPRPSCSPT